MKIINRLVCCLLSALMICSFVSYGQASAQVTDGYDDSVNPNLTQEAIDETTENAIDETEEDQSPYPDVYQDNDSSILQPKEEKRNSDKLGAKKKVTKAPELITDPYKAYSYKRLISEIDKLEKQYPELIKKDYIGKTSTGKKIPLVKLGTGKKKILILGSEHAREYVTTGLIMRSIDTYARAYEIDKKIDGADVQKVLNKVTFYFVPMVNIDGASIVTGTASSRDIKKVKKYVGGFHYRAYKNKWKSNLRGVDLNRNYPFRWSTGKSTKKRAYMEYKGPKQASEPEVKAVVKLCRQNSFSHMFTMHTRGQILYWKDQYNGDIPGASTLSKRVSSITKYKRRPASKMSTCFGESAKWFRYEYNKPAFTIELTPDSLDYKKAPKYFDKYVWKRNRSLFLRTALTVGHSSKYKVFLSGNKGKASKRYINVTKGKKYGKLPKPKRSGYKFLGWYTSKSGGSKVTKNTEYTKGKNSWIYAKWKKK